MVPWNPARTKVQIRLSIQRLRTLQEKRLALAKKSRREIADLLVKGRVETARMRVEGLIQDDIYVELLELLELYTEKLQARFGLLEVSTTEPEASIEDAVCAIVYAAPRTELKELQVLREILMHKFGRAWSITMQPSDPPPASVPPRVLSKLALYVPPQQLVDAYLGEIARSYGAPFEAAQPMDKLDDETPAEDEGDDEDGGADGPGEGQEKASASKVSTQDKDQAESSSKEQTNNKKDSEGETTSVMPEMPTAAELAPRKLTADEELAQRFERLKNLK